MDKHPVSKIYDLIRKLGIVKHKKRQEFLCTMIEGIIKSRSVIFSEIADKIEKPIQPNSIERRIQDFFEKVNFEYGQLGAFLLSFVHHDQLTLSIDRTEWDFGKTRVNILCVVISIGKMAVPLYFEMLDNNSGNSNADDRIGLFQSLIQLVSKERLALLVMDREFIGQKWLSWLKKNRIDFCVRVPKHHKILFQDGTFKSVEQLMEERKSYYAENVIVDGVVVNLSVGYGADGELLYLIGTNQPKQLNNAYRKRWTIEVFFQALKARGFNLEKSCLKCLKKYKKLFAVVAMAYTICWATGIEDGKKNPVKPKKHGYPQYSVFRRGLNLMRQFYKNRIIDPILQAVKLAEGRIYYLLKTIG